MDEIEVAIIVAIIAWKVHLPEDYLAVSNLCPFLSFARRLFAITVDTGVVHLFHDSLNEMCGVEDSFWKFHGDLWVRSVITGTDSLVILFTSGLTVLLADVALVKIMVPVVSCVHALLCWVFYIGETLLPRSPALERMESFACAVNVMDCDNQPPPVTRWRDRPGTDYLDWISYPVERRLRIPAYFYNRVSSRMEDLLKRSFIIVFVCRLYFIGFGAFNNQFSGETSWSVKFQLTAVAIAAVKFLVPICRWKHLVCALTVGFPICWQFRSVYHSHTARFGAWRAKGAEFSDIAWWHVVKRLTSIGPGEFHIILEVVVVLLVLLLGVNLLWVSCLKNLKPPW